MKEPDMPDMEQEARVLLDAAAPDPPPGIDLLRGVRARRSARRIRLRVALAAAVAVVAALAATVIPPALASGPSALAQVTGAVSRTAGQSYRLSSTTTRALSPGNGRPTTVWTSASGAFDPARRIGAETMSNGTQIRFIGGYVYLHLGPPGLHVLPGGQSWFRMSSPALWGAVTAGRQLRLAKGLLSVAETGPQYLFALLESVSEINRQGSASGPGWTGTKYAFSVTVALGPAGRGSPTLHVSGTIEVDQQGWVRHIDAAYTLPAMLSAPLRWLKVQMTFSDFGAPVSVSAPPARDVLTVSRAW
jgi:hypothetical protein